jgi:hypothetical protein
MDDKRCILITFCDCCDLFKVAIKTNLLSEENIKYFHEYEDVIKSLLPTHCKNIGRIVNVEGIFEII